MTYRVFWSPEAEDQLEVVLREPASRSEIVAAARDINRSLAKYPFRFGESRYDAVRIGFAKPLGVQYEIHDDVKTVIVFDVWRTDQRKT